MWRANLEQWMQNVPLVEIDISLLAGNVSETTTDTLDGGKGNGNLVLAVDVGVQKTKNVLELIVDGVKILLTMSRESVMYWHAPGSSRGRRATSEELELFVWVKEHVHAMRSYIHSSPIR